jgi:hypothetical protein
MKWDLKNWTSLQDKCVQVLSSVSACQISNKYAVLLKIRLTLVLII